MKIAILTHPLGANYGGILQAYALSCYLQRKGHNVVVLNRQPNHNIFIRFIKKLLITLGHPRYNNPRYLYLRRFIKKYINYSQAIYSTRSLNSFLKRNKIEVVVVGSDQVWRKDFAMGYGYNYFLDFVPDETIRIAYAASFGLSTWDYTQEQTCEIEKLIKRFANISVREDEGVALCRKYLNIEASHVLDPTMLLKVEEYENIMSPRIVEENYVFVYWLGSEKAKKEALVKITDKTKRIVDISLRGDQALIAIENWLSYIKYADQVITDSFHGCVFSILFHKQFILSANNSGGNGRLSSLFRMLDINTEDKELDFKIIEKRLNGRRVKSEQFINKALQ